VRGETSGRDDDIDRTDPKRALDGVDAVELTCHLAELVRAHRSPQVGQRDAQQGSLVALSAVQAGRELDHPRIGVRAAWPVWALGNHDIMRLATRFDQDGRGPLRARVAAMMLLTLRGTALLYHGDEIGMTNLAVPARDAVDIDGRDGARTPMQWSRDPTAGFPGRTTLRG
jgi:glycosidase